jgi:DNA-binding LytR/AlgR family response regulator
VSSTTELFSALATSSGPLSARIGEPQNAALPALTTERSATLLESWLQAQRLARHRPARIAFKAKGKILLINAKDVIAVEAKGNYILLFHALSSHMLRETISTMEEKLSRHGFVRIHRSVLVNAALVEEIQPSSSGEYVLRVKGGRAYTVTRTYKKNLQLLAQSWIGMDRFVAG